VWLKPGQKIFGGYLFNLPWKQEKGYSIPQQEPEFLGYDYVLLGPEDLGGYGYWQTIPLVLIAGLMRGELEPDGTTILEASERNITYSIKGFADEIVIPEPFAGYLRQIGKIDQMVSMGILDQRVASIVEKTLGQSEAEREASLPSRKEVSKNEGNVKREISKKAKAFQLFSEGKRPGTPEVKSLGIKPNTAYRYYQWWKRTSGHI